MRTGDCGDVLMRVAACQMPVSVCYDADVVAHLRVRVRECEDAGVALLCCPEAAIGGLLDYLDAADEIAIPAEPPALATKLRPLESSSVTVIVGFTERSPSGRYHNAAAVYSKGEVVGVYRKRHPAIRRSRYTPGTETPVFEVGGIVVGILICRDSMDADLAKTLVARGAQVLCVPTNNAMPPGRCGPDLIDEVRALDAQHAQRLGVSIIRADVIGEARGVASPGTSMITLSTPAWLGTRGAPEGELLVADLP